MRGEVAVHQGGCECKADGAAKDAKLQEGTTGNGEIAALENDMRGNDEEHTPDHADAEARQDFPPIKGGGGRGHDETVRW